MSETPAPPTTTTPAGERPPLLARVLALATLGAGGLVLLLSADARHFVVTGGRLLLNPDVAQGIRDLRDFLAPYGERAWIYTSLLMIVQSLAAPIPSAPITLVNALLYGPWLGTLISWSSAEVAAALSFLLARALGRPFVAKLFRPALIDRIDGFFRRDGLVAVLVLRLIPFVSFDVVSYAAGLTSMRLLPFLLATGAGQLPATIVYSFAGASLLTSPRHALEIALVFLGAMALLVALIAWKRRQARPA